MKKTLLFAAALVCGLMATVSFTACGSDDDKDPDVATSASVEYSWSLSNDLLKYYNVKVKYFGLGEEMNEQVSAENIKKTGESKTLPATFGYEFTFSPKEGVDLPSKVTYKFTPKMNVKVYNQNGKQMRSKNIDLTGNEYVINVTGNPADFTETLLEKARFTYVVPQDGKL